MARERAPRRRRRVRAGQPGGAAGSRLTITRHGFGIAIPAALAVAVAGLFPAAPAARAQAGGEVTFLVTAPASTPSDAVLWVSGDLEALGVWNGAGLRLEPLGAGRHAARVSLPRGTRFEFKVTRGGWQTVEKDSVGREIANRRHVVVGHDTLRIEVGAWRDQTGEVPQAPSYTGEIRRHAAFPSAHVRARDILVYLPPGHDRDPARRYPVVYFHDGQNVFDASTSTIGVEWGVDEVAERAIRAGTLPPFIAVAVSNTGERIAEYTPAADARHGGGRAADYARFLIEELKPFVDGAYPTLAEPAHTAVVGSSLGGLVSLYLGLEHPDVFGAVGCVSPSVWFADRAIVRLVESGRGAGLRIWLDMGTDEGRAAQGAASSIRGARALRAALVRRGYRAGRDLRYLEVKGAGHDERAWAARVEPLLDFLLGGRRPEAAR